MYYSVLYKVLLTGTRDECWVNGPRCLLLHSLTADISSFCPPIYALFEMDNLKPTTKSEVVIDIISEDKTTFYTTTMLFYGPLIWCYF